MPVVAPALATKRIEASIANLVVVCVAAPGVRGCQFVKRGCHRVGMIAHALIAANQIGIRVDQNHIPAFEPACPMEIEEHGAAAEEWFDVAVELRAGRSAAVGAAAGVYRRPT